MAIRAIIDCRPTQPFQPGLFDEVELWLRAARALAKEQGLTVESWGIDHTAVIGGRRYKVEWDNAAKAWRVEECK